MGSSSFSLAALGRRIEEGVCHCILNLNGAIRDLGAFQHLLLLVRSTIQGLNIVQRTDRLARLVEVLQWTESFDVYGCFRLPRHLLHPYRPERIDEVALRDGLVGSGWGTREEVQGRLSLFLSWMGEEGLDCRSASEFRELFGNWISRCEYSPVDLSSLSIPLKPSDWLEALVEAVAVSVDLLCLPAFFRDWSWLDLSRQADRIGRFPLLAWVPGQSLDDLIWSVMGVGAVLQWASAYRSPMKGAMGERRRQMAASLTQALYCAAMVQKWEPRIRPFCALFAASCGLLAFFSAPQAAFFTDDASPSPPPRP